MKTWDEEKIKARINEVLPNGRVVPRHSDRGHFYEVIDGNFSTPPIYPSVTGKLQILKDEGLMNYKMNRAIEYVFANFKKFDDGNIMEHLDAASRVSVDILNEAGDLGRKVHDTREIIFRKWMETGVMPKDFPSHVELKDGELIDSRVISCLRALEKFCQDYSYKPIACELLVYDHDFEVAGTLDDLGFIRKVIRQGNNNCEHEMVGNHCIKCDYKYRNEFILMDLKTSNQFKDHYFFQVAMYWLMFKKLIGKGFVPERCIIVKVSKEDGSYAIEDLKKVFRLSQYAQHMLKTNEALKFIRELRTDNQRNVVTI